MQSESPIAQFQVKTLGSDIIVNGINLSFSNPIYFGQFYLNFEQIFCINFCDVLYYTP